MTYNNNPRASIRNFLSQIASSSLDNDIHEQFILVTIELFNGNISKQSFNSRTTELLNKLERRRQKREKARKLENAEQLEDQVSTISTSAKRQRLEYEEEADEPPPPPPQYDNLEHLVNELDINEYDEDG